MNFLATDLTHLSVGNSALVAVLGYAVVFFGIILLMIVVMIMGKIFVVRDKKAAEKKAAAADAAVATVSDVPRAVAPGAAGELKLHDVEPKTAAILMAIVADKLGKPLNELRFISIKEVK